MQFLQQFSRRPVSKDSLKRKAAANEAFAGDQFKELIKRNLSVPVKLYHL